MCCDKPQLKEPKRLIDGTAIAEVYLTIYRNPQISILGFYIMVKLSNVRHQALIIGAVVSVTIIIVIETNSSLWLIAFIVVAATARLSQLFNRWRPYKGDRAE